MDTSTILNSYGLAGLVMASLSTVIIVLYRDNKALQEKLRDSQQARVDDQKEYKSDIAVPLKIQGEIMDLIYRKLYDAKKDA
jgi:hypothetical protein